MSPNLKNIRKIIGFLFEIMFKDEEEARTKREAEEPKNTFAYKLLQRLTQFKQKPWLLPEF